jgi:hypothetical protein
MLSSMAGMFKLGQHQTIRSWSGGLLSTGNCSNSNFEDNSQSRVSRRADFDAFVALGTARSAENWASCEIIASKRYVPEQFRPQNNDGYPSVQAPLKPLSRPQSELRF